MLNNYFKITLRNLTRDKGFTFINIGGLAIGLGTISWLSIRTALMNPVESLRSE